MDGFLRRATPLVLLVLAGLAWFGHLLPGHDAIERALGEDAVLRFVTGLLCIYMVMLVLERQRMEQAFKQVLGAFRNFRAEAGGGGGGKPADDAAKAEAVGILIGALESDDAAVRDNAVTHLERLTGQKLGADAGAWRRWAEAAGGGAAGR